MMLSFLAEQARRGRRRARSGQATVEFTFVMMFGLLAIILGTIEIGRGVWYYNQLSQLSREGARALIVSGARFVMPGDPATQKQYVWSGNWPGTYTLATYDATAFVGADTTAVGWIKTMDIGIPHDQVTVTIAIEGIDATDDPALEPANRYTYGRPASVHVRYPYQPIVAQVLGIPTTITLEAQTVMQME